MVGNILGRLHRCLEIVRTKITKYEYAKTIERLRSRAVKGPIRVLFLVNESSKWKCQAVCDEMFRRGYKLTIGLTVADPEANKSVDIQLKKMDETERFFIGRGFCVKRVFDIKKRKPIDIRSLHPDVVFYPHPWSIHKKQLPAQCASFAITCYIPYFVPTFGNPGMHLGQAVHKEIFAHFVLNKEWEHYYRQIYDKLVYAGEIIGLGHPMIDDLIKNKVDEKHDEDGVVIYAPHWSVPGKALNSFLDLSTFMINGKIILDYAQRHPDVKWAFKPHPTLRNVLWKYGFMTRAEVDEYYGEWEKIAEACYTGNYVDLFRRSRAIITDCDSFLIEYACTKKPIIHLISPVPNKRKYSPSQALFDTYYKVHDNLELLKVLDDVVVGRCDKNRDARLTALDKSGLLKSSAANSIVGYIENVLKIDTDD